MNRYIRAVSLEAYLEATAVPEFGGAPRRARRIRRAPRKPPAWWDDPQDLEVLEFGRAVERLGRRRARRGPARPLKLGRNLQVVSRSGSRAASLTLKPGMWLVCEVPEKVAAPDAFGALPLVPLLGPALIKQAAPILNEMIRKLRQREGALSSDADGTPTADELRALLKLVRQADQGAAVGCARCSCRGCSR